MHLVTTMTCSAHCSFRLSLDRSGSPAYSEVMSDLDQERGPTRSDDDEFTETQFTESQSGDYEPEAVTAHEDDRPLDEDDLDVPVPDSERVVVMDEDLEL